MFCHQAVRQKNPTAILNNSKFESMLLGLRDNYDKIIIDSPPLAAVSDSLNIVPLVDAIIYVIKYDAVKKSLANTCIRRLWESKTPVLGAVLNNVALGLSTYYYSQYSANKNIVLIICRKAIWEISMTNNLKNPMKLLY